MHSPAVHQAYKYPRGLAALVPSLVVRRGMFSSSSSSIFDNPEALAKLAELNPVNPEHNPSDPQGERQPARTGTEGRRTIASSGAKIKEAQLLGTPWPMKPNPSWIKERLELVESIKARNVAEMENVPKPAIVITLPDGKEMPGVAWETSPLDIASALSKGLMQAVCVANVKYSSREQDPRAVVEMATSPDDEDEVEAAAGQAKAEWELWDASRPLEGNCELELIKFDDQRGKQTFWHSTAHILGEALEDQFSAQLTHGPPTSTGFFYDSWMGGSPYVEGLKDQTEKRVMKIAAEKQPFERVVVTKEEALQLFAGNPFKQALIASKLPAGSSTTVYQNGPFVDLCKGPHIANTSRVKAFAVTKNSAALWSAAALALRARPHACWAAARWPACPTRAGAVPSCTARHPAAAASALTAFAPLLLRLRLSKQGNDRSAKSAPPLRPSPQPRADPEACAGQEGVDGRPRYPDGAGTPGRWWWERPQQWRATHSPKRRQRPAAARLRRRLPRQEGVRRVEALPGGGGEARPPQDRPRAGRQRWHRHRAVPAAIKAGALQSLSLSEARACKGQLRPPPAPRWVTAAPWHAPFPAQAWSRSSSTLTTPRRARASFCPTVAASTTSCRI